MSNIVERLRSVYVGTPKHVVILHNLDVCREAADEIDRLREALNALVNHPFATECQECGIGQSEAFRHADALVKEVGR